MSFWIIKSLVHVGRTISSKFMSQMQTYYMFELVIGHENTQTTFQDYFNFKTSDDLDIEGPRNNW